jgi:hypothetical protein
VQHATSELLGRRVDQLDLIRFAHDPIRDTFPDPRSRHVLDLVGDALQVLDVDGSDDVDPRGEDFQDILPPPPPDRSRVQVWQQKTGAASRKSLGVRAWAHGDC